MSVLEELTGLEDKVRARMTELRPLLDEYAALEKAAHRLGIDSAEPKSTPSRRAGASRQSTKARRTPASDAVAAAEASTPAPEPARKRTRTKAKPKKSQSSKEKQAERQPGGSRSGERAEQVAALVARRPGISVKELGTEVGVDPTSLYRVVKQLEGDGKLTKRGRELHPA